MRTITVADKVFSVDKFYKQGASTFYSDDEVKNPYWVYPRERKYHHKRS